VKGPIRATQLISQMNEGAGLENLEHNPFIFAVQIIKVAGTPCKLGYKDCEILKKS